MTVVLPTPEGRLLDFPCFRAMVTATEHAAAFPQVSARDAGHLTMFTVDGQPNTVTDLAASASSRVSYNEIPPFSMLGRSDHVPFYQLGIPAALFIHTPLEPWYHTPEDTIDKVDPDKVLDVTKIVGAALFNGVRKDTPALHRSAVRPVPVDYYYYEDPHLS